VSGGRTAAPMPERQPAGLRLELVPLADWRARCAAVLADGDRFLALYAANRGVTSDAAIQGGLGVRALFAGPHGPRLLVSTAPAGEAVSIVDLVPAAGWDEREAHDLYGLRFAGHSPLRPLLEHSAELSAWTLPVSGRDVHQVAVGPIHAGIIESGHFRFHVVGESILHLDLRLFYKHRGLERAAEGRSLPDGLAYAQRACAACAVSNAVAYAHASESLLGLWPEPELARARTLLLELERLYNHLNDIGAVCAGVGFAPGSMAFAALKERAHRLNRSLTGHRFLFDTITVGGSDWQVGRDTAAEARRQLRALGDDARRAWHEVLFNASVQDRLLDIGVLSPDDVRRLGVVGPAARAAGFAIDVRVESPRLAYQGFSPAVAHSASGDVASRMNVRALEVEVTLDLLDELLGEGVRSAGTTSVSLESVGVASVESPRGETVCILEADDGRVSRLHLRSASFANWPAVARATAGNLLPDFPLINKSFELCYSCCDR
jgi:Ni,Fe-hydrogenase III large subunit